MGGGWEEIPSRVGLVAKPPPPGAENATLRRKLLSLQSEFAALSKKHGRVTAKSEEVVDELRRLRGVVEGKDKECTALRRAVESLSLEKGELATVVSADKAYKRKLEDKLAAELGGLDLVDRHERLRAKHKELQGALSSVNAVLASTQASLDNKSNEVQSLQEALKIRAEELASDNVHDAKPSLLAELAKERELRLSLSLRLAQKNEEMKGYQTKLQCQSDQAHEREEQLVEQTERLREEMDAAKRLAEEKERQLKAELAQKHTACMAMETELGRSRREAKHLTKEHQKLVAATAQDQVRFHSALAQESGRAQALERALGDERARSKELSLAMLRSTQALDTSQKTAQLLQETMKADAQAAKELQAAKTAEDRERLSEALRRVDFLQVELAEARRQQAEGVAEARRAGAVELGRVKQEAEEQRTALMATLKEEADSAWTKASSEVDELKGLLRAEEAKVETLNKELEASQSRQEELETEISNLHNEIDHFTEVNETIQGMSVQEREMRLKQLETTDHLREQVTLLQRGLSALRDSKASNESTLKARVEANLAELQSVLEERNRLRATLHEANASHSTSKSQHGALIAENKALRDQVVDITHSKTNLQRSMSEKLAALKAQVEHGQLQLRELQNSLTRQRAENKRYQALVQAERRSSAALAQQCTATLRTVSLNTPIPALRNHSDILTSLSSRSNFRSSTVPSVVRQSPFADSEPLDGQQKSPPWPRDRVNLLETDQAPSEAHAALPVPELSPPSATGFNRGAGLSASRTPRPDLGMEALPRRMSSGPIAVEDMEAFNQTLEEQDEAPRSRDTFSLGVSQGRRDGLYSPPESEGGDGMTAFDYASDDGRGVS